MNAAPRLPVRELGAGLRRLRGASPTSRRSAASRGSTKTALVVCDLFDETTGDADRGVAPPHPAAPGRTGRRARLHGACSASELEFFLFRESLDEAAAKGYADLTPHSQVIEDYHILQTTRDEYVIRAIRNGIDGAGMPVEFSKGEAGRGQHEINLVYADAVEMADRHVIYKNGAKEIAAQHGRVDHVHGQVLDRTRSARRATCTRACGTPTATSRSMWDADAPDHHVRRRSAAGSAASSRAAASSRGCSRRPSTPTSGTSPSRGRRPRSRGASTIARAASASSATARRSGSSRASPAPTPTRTSPSRRRSPPDSHGIEHGIEPPPRFDGNAYAADELRARPVEPRRGDRRVRGLEGRDRGVRRRRARPSAEHRAAGVGALQPRRHRLGAAPQLRPMVTGAARPLVAVTGRRMGELDRWPHAHALVSPAGYIDALARAGAVPVLIDPIGAPTGILDRCRRAGALGRSRPRPGRLRPGSAPEDLRRRSRHRRFRARARP